MHTPIAVVGFSKHENLANSKARLTGVHIIQDQDTSLTTLGGSANFLYGST
jgi:hypothetical protein